MVEKIVPFNIHQIVQASELADGTKLKTRKYAAGPKSLRQDLINEEPEHEDVEICAAIEIQRVWRGYRSRCKLFGILETGISQLAIYGSSKHHVKRLEDFENKDHKKTKGRVRLENFYMDYLESLGKNENEAVSFKDFCANFIQNWWGRRKLKKKPVLLRKGLLRQTGHPTEEVKFGTGTPLLHNEQAAIVIQRAWRKHIDMQVYRYYRDLINFKTRGDPSLMLRCINPNEAKLLDPALGVHVRFRLFGTKFPPNIYYKIFTHRPIVDMCANSPKDYTKAGTKQIIMRHVHNKGAQSTSKALKETEGWYERVENNGWRLVSDRLIRHIMNDPLTWESSQKKINFHHTKLQRRQDLEVKKKNRKIQWMKKMYKEGLLKAKSQDTETVRLIEGAAAGMVATVEREGVDAVEEWEVDELLDWTTSLNFEEYMTGWKEIATSANSEKPVEERLKVSSNSADPYELTVSFEPSGHFSGRQSAHENTPVSSMANFLLQA